MEHTTLEQMIERAGTVPLRQAAAIGLAVLSQLAALHDRRLLHGDVRPGTVLTTSDGHTALAGVPGPYPMPATAWSPFTPPEGRLGPASDLWSLGATLYAAVTGRPPVRGASLMETGPFSSILRALLADDPARRPDPPLIRRALNDIAQDSSLSGPMFRDLSQVPGTPPTGFPQVPGTPPTGFPQVPGTPPSGLPALPPSVPLGPITPVPPVPLPGPVPDPAAGAPSPTGPGLPTVPGVPLAPGVPAVRGGPESLSDAFQAAVLPLTAASAATPPAAETTPFPRVTADILGRSSGPKADFLGAPPMTPGTPNGPGTPATPQATAARTGQAGHPAQTGRETRTAARAARNGPGAVEKAGKALRAMLDKRKERSAAALANGPGRAPGIAAPPGSPGAADTGAVHTDAVGTGRAAPTDKVSEGRASGGRRADGRGSGGKGSGGRSSGNRASGGRSSGSRASGGRASGGKGPTGTERGDRASASTGVGSTDSRGDALEQTTSAGAPRGDTGSGNTPLDDATSGGTALGSTTPGAAPSGATGRRSETSGGADSEGTATGGRALAGRTSGGPASGGDRGLSDSAGNGQVTAPTHPAQVRQGVVVSRSVVALTTTLLVAMAVAIGVLLAPTFRDQTAPAPSATPRVAEKGRFTAVPRACSLLTDEQAAALVPRFKVSEVETGECNWLTGDWRQPNVEKYDLRIRLVAQKPDGLEVIKAREYISGKKADTVSLGALATPKPAPPQDLTGIGEEAFASGAYSSINLYGGSYKATVVFRMSNLIAEIEYERGGVKDDPDGRIAAGAERAARQLATALANYG